MISFRPISGVFAVALAMGFASCLFAQDPGGPGGPPGGPGGGPRGGFPGGGFPGGAFGGPGGGFGRRGFGGRGFGGPGGGNEFANVDPADLVRRIDTNHDGVIETNEINDRTRPLLQKAGLRTDEPISNDRVIAAFEKLKSQNGPGGRFPGGGDDDMGYSPANSGSGSSGSAAKKSDSSIPALVPAFGEAADLPLVPGFGEGLTVATASFGGDATTAATSSTASSSSSSASSSTSPSSAASGGSSTDDPKIRAYAASMMKRYDKNGDGILDKSEWSQMGGDPEKYDRNHDGKITLDEMVEGLKNWNRPDSSNSTAKPADAAASSSNGSAHPATNASGPASDSAGGGATGAGPSGRRGGFGGGRSNSSANSGPHYRSPKERLPDGLPEWFSSADADGDGQVSLHEFAPQLTEEKIAEFNKYDLNGDGFITPDEVLKVAPPKK